MIQILPSLLAANFARLGEEIAAVERAGAQILHLDVMDGHFVPNISFGLPVVESIRKVTNLTLDVHLMISDADTFAPRFIEKGADQVVVHQEACPHLDRTLRMIQAEGARAGVALNPATPAGVLEEVLELADYVLLMSVNPGFGGQKFLPHVLRKARALDRLRRDRGLSLPIAIDGGIGADNAAEAARSGCNWLIAGSSIFNVGNAEEAFRNLHEAAREAFSVRV